MSYLAFKVMLGLTDNKWWFAGSFLVAVVCFAFALVLEFDLPELCNLYRMPVVKEQLMIWCIFCMT